MTAPFEPAPLILASASPRRRDLLAQIGVPVAEILPADIDETEQPRERPRAYVARVALGKAQAVAAQRGDAFVLAADTCVAAGHRILPKAEDEATARQCLGMLSGRRHRVLGGIVLISPDGRVSSRVVETTVSFKRLTDGEIEAYIRSGEWDGKAGGYAIQGLGGRFVKQIRGSYTNVVGLSLHDTANMLEGQGAWQMEQAV
ncbi:MAG: Maf family nucleotide pyrophosphatase [Alphaproteobacteria bacterium]